MPMILVPDSEDIGSCGRWLVCDGQVQVFYYRVLYGFRLRAGWVKDRWGVSLDWCLGAIPRNSRDIVRDTLVKIIEKNSEKGLDPFAGVPAGSEVKPIWKDQLFMAWLASKVLEA